MKNLYEILVEAEGIRNFKERTNNSFEALFDEIDEYIIVGEDKVEIMDSMINNLSHIANEFTRNGQTYEPDFTSDVDEKTFIANLERYKSSASIVLSSLTAEYMEEFNSQTRYLLNLVETHKENFNEGE